MGLSICRSIVEAHGGELAVTANVPTAPSFSLRCPYTETTNKMDPRDEQRAVELRTAAAFPGRGSRAVMAPLLSLCCRGGGGQSMTWAQLSAMARQTKKALAYLHIVPAFLAMTASVVCADTLVLAAADTWPTAYLVDGRPTGMLVDLVTEAYRRAGHSVEVKLMPWARCLKDAETGEVDGVFSSFKLPERERFLAFSKEALTIQVIVFFARRESNQRFDGDLAALRDVKIGVITGTSYGDKFDAAVGEGVLRNVEQTNSIESNLKKLALGRVDLVPSYRYVALDTAIRLQLIARMKCRRRSTLFLLTWPLPRFATCANGPRTSMRQWHQ